MGIRSRRRGVFSHVFQRTRSNWQCINAQRTIVQEEAVAKAKTASAKTSNAELPFHIPLFHKGADPAPPAADADELGCLNPADDSDAAVGGQR